MSDLEQPIGSVSWTDLTVPNADKVRQFYEAVTGWKSKPLEMGGYNDYGMNLPTSGKTVAGICHARGENAELPPQWLIYITVADLEKSGRQCRTMGGKVLVGPREVGGQGRVAVIQDPGGGGGGLFWASA